MNRIVLAVLVAVSVPAFAAEAPPETTPLSLPGAQTAIYRTVGNVQMRLHVFKPVGWAPSDRRPAFIFFYGGGWLRGTAASSASWAKWGANLGMVGVAPDYRTYDRFGTSPLEAVSDGRAAYVWVQRHAAEWGIDPARIVVGGGSAGGHLALWTAITHSPPGSDPDLVPAPKPVALILISAVSDTTIERGYAPQRLGKDTVALSPIDQLDPKMPPVLAFHGDKDTTVPEAQAFALRDKLLATGNSCEFVNVPGGVHAFTGMPGWKEKTEQRMQAYLVKQKVIAAPP